MASKGKGVRIPVSLDKDQAQKDGRELADDIKKSLLPVVDVVEAAKTGFNMLKDAISTATGIAREAISAAASQEEAERKLIATLSRRGTVSQDFIDKLNAENFARQQMLAISDDEQQALQAKAALLDVEHQHLSKVTDATIGLAETTGQDLGSALNVVVKAYHGNISALKKFGIQAEDTDSILDELASRTDVAAERADTFNGRVSILQENFGELMESIGESVVRNDDVKKFFKDLNDELLGVIGTVQENGPEFKSWVSGVVQDLRDLGQWVRENKSEIGDVVKLLSLMAAGRALGGLAGGLVAGVGKWAPAIGAAGGMMMKAATGLGGWGLGTAAAGFGAAATAGSLMLLPSTDHRSVAQALMNDMGYVDPDMGYVDPARVQRGSPDFSNTAFSGQGADAGMNFDTGLEVTVDLKKMDEENKKAAARAQKEAEARWKAAEKKSEEIAKSAAELEAQEAKRAEEADERRLTQVAETANKVRDARLQELEDQKELQAAILQSQEEFSNELGQSALSTAFQFAGSMAYGLVSGKDKIKNAGKAAFGVLLNIAGDAMATIGGAITAAGFGSTMVPFLAPIFGGPAGMVAGGLITAAGVGLKMWSSDVAASARETVSRATPTRSSFAGGFDQRTSPRMMGGAGGLFGGSTINVILPNGMVLADAPTLARAIGDVLGQTAELRFA